MALDESLVLESQLVGLGLPEEKVFIGLQLLLGPFFSKGLLLGGVPCSGLVLIGALLSLPPGLLRAFEVLVLGPVPGGLVAVLVAVDDLEGHFDLVEEVGAGEVEVGAALALVDLLDDPFYVGVLGGGGVDEVVAGLLGVELLVAEVEGLVVVLDKVLEAGVVDFVVKVGVDAPLVVEVEQPENVGPLHHYHAVEPGLRQMQKVLVLGEQDLLVDLLEDHAPVAGVGLAVANHFQVPFGQHRAQPQENDQHLSINISN